MANDAFVYTRYGAGIWPHKSNPFRDLNEALGQFTYIQGSSYNAYGRERWTADAWSGKVTWEIRVPTGVYTIPPELPLGVTVIEF
jgi:hypothetical protein